MSIQRASFWPFAAAVTVAGTIFFRRSGADVPGLDYMLLIVPLLIVLYLNRERHQAEARPATVRDLELGREYKILYTFGQGEDRHAVTCASIVGAQPFILRLDALSKDVRPGRVMASHLHLNNIAP